MRRASGLVFAVMILLFSNAMGVGAWTYWVPYCNTFHIPGEVHWYSKLNFYALWDSTGINSPGVIDTVLNAGESVTISSFTSCGTEITSTKQCLIIYGTKIVTVNEYEPTEYNYTLLPSVLLGNEYFISSMHFPPQNYEYVAFTSTKNGNQVYINGALRGTYNAGECDTVHFDSLGVIHIQADSAIAVVHIGARTGHHDDFFGYSLLPTSLWDSIYIVPPPPDLWSTGYSSPSIFTKVIITGSVDGTNLVVNGLSYTIDRGERLEFTMSTDTMLVYSDNPVQVVRYFWIEAVDVWSIPTRRWYTTATNIVPPSAMTRFGYINPLPYRSPHGGPSHWYTITSYSSGNEIKIDVGFDGTFELDTTLDSLQTLVIHDTISSLPGSDSLGSFLTSSKPVGIIYQGRGWWESYIEAHRDYSEYFPYLCRPINARYICPPSGTITSCSPADAFFQLTIPRGTELDTMRTYVTVIIAHPTGDEDTLHLQEPSDHLSFTYTDSAWVMTISYEYSSGDSVTVKIDSAYTTDGCITVFGH